MGVRFRGSSTALLLLAAAIFEREGSLRTADLIQIIEGQGDDVGNRNNTEMSSLALVVTERHFNNYRSEEESSFEATDCPT